MKSSELITMSLRKYKDSHNIGIRKLGQKRYAIDVFKYTIILELWFLYIKGGLKYN